MMGDTPKIVKIYRIETGPLAGTEIEPFMFTVLVKYPHRKTRDCYVPPYEDKEKGITHPWKCCQCDAEFKGKLPELSEHLELHAGRLLKKTK